MIRQGPLVGLTRYVLIRDKDSRIRYPAIPDEPGLIHAIRPTVTEPALTDPYFIEHTQDYRAAICGALIKVVLPLSFKTTEPGVCPECIEELQQPSAPAPWLGNPFEASHVGESWWANGSYKHPGWVRRRAQERQNRACDSA